MHFMQNLKRSMWRYLRYSISFCLGGKLPHFVIHSASFRLSTTSWILTFSMFVIPLLFNILWLNVHVSVKHCSELSGTNSTQLPLIHFVVACRDKINKWHLIPGYTYPQTCQFISCLYMHPTFDLVNQPKTKD